MGMLHSTKSTTPEILECAHTEVLNIIKISPPRAIYFWRRASSHWRNRSLAGSSSAEFNSVYPAIARKA